MTGPRVDGPVQPNVIVALPAAGAVVGARGISGSPCRARQQGQQRHHCQDACDACHHEGRSGFAMAMLTEQHTLKISHKSAASSHYRFAHPPVCCGRSDSRGARQEAPLKQDNCTLLVAPPAWHHPVRALHRRQAPHMASKKRRKCLKSSLQGTTAMAGSCLVTAAAAAAAAASQPPACPLPA